MSRNFRNLCSLLPASVVVGIAAISTAAAGSSAESKAVWDGHLQKVMEHDLDAVMADFTDNSAIITVDAIYCGTEAIRGFLAGFIDGLTPEAAKSLVVQAETALGNVVLFKFTIGAADRTFVDTAVIDGGKILTITTASYPAE
jgi:hypothetical protein